MLFDLRQPDSAQSIARRVGRYGQSGALSRGVAIAVADTFRDPYAGVCQQQWLHGIDDAGRRSRDHHVTVSIALMPIRLAVGEHNQLTSLHHVSTLASLELSDRVNPGV